MEQINKLIEIVTGIGLMIASVGLVMEVLPETTKWRLQADIRYVWEYAKTFWLMAANMFQLWWHDASGKTDKAWVDLRAKWQGVRLELDGE